MVVLLLGVIRSALLNLVGEGQPELPIVVGGDRWLRNSLRKGRTHVEVAGQALELPIVESAGQEPALREADRRADEVLDLGIVVLDFGGQSEGGVGGEPAEI